MSRPSISQIYSAFNSASHKVFRRAMRNSSGGTLRVRDLVSAILELNLPPAHPELDSPSTALQRLAATSLVTSKQAHLVPMSNDPALQEVLERAWCIATWQISDEAAFASTSASSVRQQRVSITPACLAASALIQRGRLPVGERREAVFSGLGLEIPIGLLLRNDRNDQSSEPTETLVTSGRSNFAVRDSGTIVLNSSRSEAGLIDDALELWLNLQSIQDSVELKQAKTALSDLVEQIELSP